MKSVQSIIEKLTALNLSNFPVEEIKSLLKDLGSFGIIKLTLHKRKTVMRARPNEFGKTFKLVSELNYKQANLNTKFQRASTPNTTMFYGCVNPGNIVVGIEDDAIMTTIFEVSKLLRKGNENGEEKITFSSWKVIEDIPLVAIVYHKDFINNSKYTNELFEAYKAFSTGESDEKLNIITLLEYIANEFAKSETFNEYDYLISALFTEIILKDGYAGVYYPSCRVDGKGFNVAIHPYFVDNYMLPIYSGDCTLYKKGERVWLDNDSNTAIEIGQTEIFFNPIIDSKSHFGCESIYKILNGDSTV